MRLMIVDDFRFIRRHVRALLGSIPGADVVAEAASGEEAVALARELRPEVVLMDISLHGMNGLAATETIRRELPEVQVLIVSRHVEAEYVLKAVRAGACGYLPKGALAQELRAALAAVERGAAWISPSIRREHLAEIDLPLAPHRREIPEYSAERDR